MVEQLSFTLFLKNFDTSLVVKSFLMLLLSDKFRFPFDTLCSATIIIIITCINCGGGAFHLYARLRVFVFLLFSIVGFLLL